MAEVNWEACRNLDGSIDLVKAWREAHPNVFSSNVEQFLLRIESIRKITSRQVAAIAICTAEEVISFKDEVWE